MGSKMNKNIIFRIFLLLSLVTGAHAETVTGDGITLDYVIPYGGSALGLTDSMTAPTIFLNDLKGQSVIGESADAPSGITGYWGWGYMWGAASVIQPGAPEGSVPLSISKQWFSSGTNVILTWEANIYPSIQLYMLTGDGAGNFTNEPAGWVRVNDPSPGFVFYQGQIIHYGGSVNGGHSANGEVYYKALQSSYASRTNYGDYLKDAWAVGKMDYSFGKGNNYFNYPFVNTNSINTVLGAAGYATLSKLLYYNKTSDDFAYWVLNTNASTGRLEWSPVFATGNMIPTGFEIGKGYVFSNQGDTITTTLVGEVDRYPDLFIANLGLGNNLIGLPFPIKKQLLTLFSPSNLDKLLVYQKTTDDFNNYTYMDGYFADKDGVNQDAYFVLPGVGYFYSRMTSSSLEWRPRP